MLKLTRRSASPYTVLCVAQFNSSLTSFTMPKTTSIGITPLADRVVVMPITQAKSRSGIIIAEGSTKERPERGTVIAVGKGKIGDDNKRIPLEVTVGDTVIFSKYGPDEIKVDGAEYYILREDQILAIIK